MRITERILDERAAWIRQLGFSIATDYGYGQVRVVEQYEGGAIRELCGFGSNKEAYAFMAGMLASMTLMNRKKVNIVQQIMLDMPVAGIGVDKIASPDTTYVVGCHSRGKIAVECHNIEAAQHIMDEAPFLANDGYAIYTRAEWTGGFQSI